MAGSSKSVDNAIQMYNNNQLKSHCTDNVDKIGKMYLQFRLFTCKTLLI